MLEILLFALELSCLVQSLFQFSPQLRQFLFA
jgi:hypothetical protein